MKSDFYLYIAETTSTNKLMAKMLLNETLNEGYIIHTDFQTMGKGQRANSWESAKGKNLLFSQLLKPLHIPINEQFRISQLCSNGIIYVLRNLKIKDANNFSIKWPNDIYWKDKKLGGILIENNLQGNKIKNSTLGIGLNINQTEFSSDSPNPISLKQITGKDYKITELLFTIAEKILDFYYNSSNKDIYQYYMQNLYRKEGYYSFRASNITFEARIYDILPDGKLILEDKKGKFSSFYFKEVEWIN